MRDLAASLGPLADETAARAEACHAEPDGTYVTRLRAQHETQLQAVADWLATSAGSGIQVCFIGHTPAQLRVATARTPPGRSGPWPGPKIVLGGNSDAEMAEEISTLAGMYGGEMALPVVPVAYLRQRASLRPGSWNYRYHPVPPTWTEPGAPAPTRRHPNRASPPCAVRSAC